jgi:hypothetical protein
MSRRIALPGADELFRQTGDPSRQPEPETTPSPSEPTPAPAVRAVPDVPDLAPLGTPPAAEEAESGLEEASAAVRTAPRRRPRSVAERRPSGRERHEEKITVYVSPDELMDLEHARLTLRGDFGLPVDRGRVVREALAVVLADLEAKGEASILVRRLRGR